MITEGRIVNGKTGSVRQNNYSRKESSDARGEAQMDIEYKYVDRK